MVPRLESLAPANLESIKSTDYIIYKSLHTVIMMMQRGWDMTAAGPRPPRPGRHRRPWRCPRDRPTCRIPPALERRSRGPHRNPMHRPSSGRPVRPAPSGSDLPTGPAPSRTGFANRCPWPSTPGGTKAARQDLVSQSRPIRLLDISGPDRGGPRPSPPDGPRLESPRHRRLRWRWGLEGWLVPEPKRPLDPRSMN